VQGSPDTLYFSRYDQHLVRSFTIDFSSGIFTASGAQTIAGNGSAGFSGDGGPATSAQLNTPKGLYVNGSTVYVVDSGNNRIRQFALGSTISTIAGTAIAGYNGDNMSAISAQLNAPQGIALNGATVFVADSGNNFIRQFSSGSTISTFAGVLSLGGYSGNWGPATAALISGPNGVYADSSTTPPTIYFADAANNAVRKIDAAGVMSTIAGASPSGTVLTTLNGPRGIFLDSSKNIYIADALNNRIQMIAGSTFVNAGTTYTAGQIYTIASGLNRPSGIYVDSSGYIFVADSSNNRIIRFLLGSTPTAIAGGGSDTNMNFAGLATSASLSIPYGIWGYSAGNIYFSEQGRSAIRKLFSNNTYSVPPGSTQTISESTTQPVVTGGGTEVLPPSNSVTSVEVANGTLQVSSSAPVTFNATPGGAAVVEVTSDTDTGAYNFTTAGTVQVNANVVVTLSVPPSGTGTMNVAGPGVLKATQDLSSSTTPMSIGSGSAVVVTGSTGRLPTAPTAVNNGATLQLGTPGGTVAHHAVPGASNFATGSILSLPNGVQVPNDALSNPTIHSGVTLKFGNGARVTQGINVVA